MDKNLEGMAVVTEQGVFGELGVDIGDPNVRVIDDTLKRKPKKDKFGNVIKDEDEQ